MNSPQTDYDRIIHPIEQKMMRSVWRITQNANDADDAFQEAIRQILRTMPRIRTHANPQALVLRICANVACDLVRRRKRRNTRERPFSIEKDVDPNGDGCIAAVDNERAENVAMAIARLPKQQATAITMRFLLCCPYEEIAQAMDCAEATVRVHVARGLKRLRDLLSPLNPSSKSES